MSEPTLRIIASVYNVSVMAIQDGISAGVVDADYGSQKEGWWWLARLFVRPECRGKGLGKKLLAELLTELGGRSSVSGLLVAPGGYGSDPAELHKFYAANGFVAQPDGTLTWTPPREAHDNQAAFPSSIDSSHLVGRDGVLRVLGRSRKGVRSADRSSAEHQGGEGNMVRGKPSVALGRGKRKS